MKKVYILLMAMLLILTGCAGIKGMKDIRVTDAMCPYTVQYKKGVLEVTLQNQSGNPLQWQVKAMPNDVCKVAEVPQTVENTVCYTITGEIPGAAQLTFTALREDGTATFELNMIVEVGSNKKATVQDYEHQESEHVAEESNGLSYAWDVDVDGILTFSFTNTDDFWSVSNTKSTVYKFTTRLSSPSGCSFGLRALAAGQDTVILTSETAQRTIHVVVQVDDAGNLTVVSVQEQ